MGMAELNGSKLSANSTNHTHTIHHCTGLGPSKSVEIATYSVIMFLSLIGNSLVVAVFYRKKVLRTTVNCFIVSMTVSDLIIPFIVLPALISEAHLDRVWLVEGTFGNILCKIYWFAGSVSTAVSIGSMVVIAVDRFYAMLFAMKPVLISRKACRRIIVITWILAVAFRAHYLYAARLVFSGNKPSCQFSHLEAMLIASMTSQLCLFVLSGLLLMVCYLSIIAVLWRQKSVSSGITGVAKHRARENRRVTCMLLVVVVVFYAVWIPHLYNSAMFILRKNAVQQPCYFLWISEYSLPVLNTVINPVVYYIFNEKYRQAFKELLCCQKGRKDSVATGQITLLPTNKP